MSSVLKLVASNTIAQLVAKFVGAGLTLLTTYFTIRLAGLSIYGDLTKVLAIVAIGFTGIDFGLNADVVRSNSGEDKLKEAVRNAFSARLLLSVVAIVILNLLVHFLPGGYSESVKAVFFLGSLSILFQGVYTSANAYFQSKLSYWNSATSVILGSIFGTLLTFYFLFSTPTLQGFIFATTAGYAVIAGVSLLLLGIPLKELIHFRAGLTALKSSFLLGSILIASVVASKLDTIILGIYQSSSVVGQYGLAYRIFEVILTLPTFTMNAMYPLMVKGIPRLLKHSLIGLGILGVFAGICIWILAPFITLIKPGELNIAILSLRLLALSLPLFYLTSPLMWGLVAKRYDSLVLAVYIFAAIFNGLSNLLVIPSYGAPGAAIVTGVTELIIFLPLLYFSVKKS